MSLLSSNIKRILNHLGYKLQLYNANAKPIDLNPHRILNIEEDF